MFSKGRTQAAPPAVQTSGSNRPIEAKSAGVPSIVSPDLTVHGNLASDGDIQVDGRVEGDVVAGNLTIGEQGAIEGKVEAVTVRIRGAVQGEVHGDSVTLLNSARVHGDIVHNSLSIEAGAWLEGHCRRRDAQGAQQGRSAGAAARAGGERKAKRAGNGAGAEVVEVTPESGAPAAGSTGTKDAK